MAGIAQLITAGIGLGGNILGGIMNNNQQQWIQNSMVDALNYNRGQAGSALQDYWRFAGPSRDMLLDIYQRGYQGAFGNDSQPGSVNFMNDYVRNTLGGLTPGQFDFSNLSPGAEQDINNYQGIMSRMDPFYNNMYGVLENGGQNDYSRFTGDRVMDSIMSGGPYSNQRNIASEIFNNRGQTAFGNILQDRASDALNYGGNNPTTSGMQNTAFGFLNQLGSNPMSTYMQPTGFQQGAYDIGAGLFGNNGQLPTDIQSGLSQGNRLLNSANNNSFQPNFNIFNNTQAADSLLSGGNQMFSSAFNNGGYTQGINNVSGNAQNLFDSMMSSGGYTPQSNAVINQGMDLINSAGNVDPMVASLFSMGSGMMSGGGINASRPTYQAPTGDGSTEHTRYLSDRMRGIYDGSESPLLSMDANISMARDSAGAAQAAAGQRAYRQAAQRGLTGAGSVVGGGNVGAMNSDFQQEILADQAARMRDAVNNRQTLGLQERQMADQLGLGIGQLQNQRYGDDLSAATSRYATDANMYGNELSNQTSRMAAGANAASAAASARASMYGSALGAGSNLALGGLNDATSRFNTGTGNALQAQLSAEGLARDRYLGELSNGVNALTNSGQLTGQRQGQMAQYDLGIQGLNSQNYLGNINAGVNLLGNTMASGTNNRGNNLSAGTSLLNNSVNSQQNQFATGAGYNLGLGGLANNMFGTSFENELGRLNSYGQFGLAGANNELSRLALGMNMDTNAGQGYNDMLGMYNSLGQQGFNNVMTAGGGLGSAINTQLGAMSGIGATRQNDYNRQLGSSGAYWDVVGNLINQGQNNANRDVGLFTTAQQGMNSMAQPWLNAYQNFGMSNPFSNQQLPQSSALGNMFSSIGQNLGQFAQTIPWLQGNRGQQQTGSSSALSIPMGPGGTPVFNPVWAP